MTDTTERPVPSSVAGWRYEINHGPDGETDWANVYDEANNLVGNFRTHHAIKIVALATPSLSRQAGGETPLYLDRTSVRSAIISFLATYKASIVLLADIDKLPIFTADDLAPASLKSADQEGGK